VKSSPAPLDDYSEVANQQLDTLEQGPDADLYNEIIEVCAKIFDNPDHLRRFSTVIQTTEGTRFRTPVPGKEPYKIFWLKTSEGLVRIEAVFPYSM
jgi:hypothetical protein